ncbi:hypothetical protein HGB07_02195 [Candidatus Roizmanbacteria bacterium]|nr:hypothetical protein [Candidatus Roizmanbacteria bacterium]
MRRFWCVNLFVFVLAFVAFSLITQASYAATLKFDQTNISKSVGDTFSLQVIADPGVDPILSTDAFVLYDSNLLEATSVTDGTLFPSVNKNISSDKISIWGVITDPSKNITTSGTIATINFKALKAGTYTLTFFCDLTSSDTSRIVKDDANNTNVITCSQSGTAAVTITGSGNSPTANLTLTPTPTVTSVSSSDSSNPTNTPTPTVISTTASTVTPPTQLPQTGGLFDIFRTIAIPGMMLLVIGGVLRLLH